MNALASIVPLNTRQPSGASSRSLMHMWRTCALVAALIIATAGLAPSAWAQQEASWETLMQASFEETSTPEGLEWTSVFPSEIEQLDGRSVQVVGYMIPLSFEKEQTHFLISAYPGDGCFFHLPGGPNSVVEVKADRGMDFTYDTIAITGQLELLHDDPWGLMYRLSDAKPAK